MLTQHMMIMGSPESCNDSGRVSKVVLVKENSQCENPTLGDTLNTFLQIQLQVHSTSWASTIESANHVKVTITSTSEGECILKECLTGTYVTSGLVYSNHSNILGISFGGLLSFIEFAAPIVDFSNACVLCEGSELMLIVNKVHIDNAKK